MKTTLLDFNTPNDEYLAFDSSSYTFWVTCINGICEKVQMTQHVFINLTRKMQNHHAQFFCLPFSLSLCFCVVYCLFVYFSYHLLFKYWLQGNAERNFNQHLIDFKAHYCFEKLLELVKTSNASLPLIVAKICLTILFVSALDM